MNSVNNLSAKLFLMSGLLLLVFSCSKDLEEANLDLDQKVEAAEVKTILETDDFSSAADDVVTDLFQQGSSAKSAKNVECYQAEYSDTGFAVTFDNCSVEEGGAQLTGMVTVVYTVGQEETSFTATYTDLIVDGILINGTRGFTMNGSGENISFTVVSEMNIKLADDSVIEEMGTKTIGFEFDSENFFNSALTIGGNWTVKADGNTYTVNISSILEANFNCDYVGKGVMQLSKNGLEVSIDFGDGACDDLASMTYPDGTVDEISLKD